MLRHTAKGRRSKGVWMIRLPIRNRKSRKTIKPREFDAVIDCDEVYLEVRNTHDRAKEIALISVTSIAPLKTNRICCTIEIDEKFCDVIVNRAIQEFGNSDGVFLIRDGVEYKYKDVPGIGAETYQSPA